MGKRKAETKVINYLLAQINQRTLQPGTRLIELDIAKNVGVSRSPVRSAFQKLSEEGYLELHQNRGAVVVKKSLSQADFLERLEILALLLTHYVFELEKWERIISVETRNEWLSEVALNQLKNRQIIAMFSDLLSSQQNTFSKNLLLSLLNELLIDTALPHAVTPVVFKQLLVASFIDLVGNLQLKKYKESRKNIRLFVNNLSLLIIDKQEVVADKYK